MKGVVTKNGSSALTPKIRSLTVILVFLLDWTAYAGQSLVLTSGMTSATVVDPLLPDNQSWRIEFQMHDWNLPPAGVYSAYIFLLDGTGAKASIWPDGRLALGDDRDNVARHDLCYMPLTGRSNVLVRFQRNLANMTVNCEMWNSDGTGYTHGDDVITGIVPYPSWHAGGTIGAGASTNLAFLRIDKNLVPLGAKPPTTAGAGKWTELKFDGRSLGLKDASGNGHSIAASRLVFVPTPSQSPVAWIKTAGAPPWSAWVSLRAGYPAQLDGSSSFSLADTSEKVRYLWKQLDGPTTLRWSSDTEVKPTIEGLVFGTYKFRLQVTDTAGATATRELEVGAVATDDNGVVVNADPNVDKIFGPMIAFGKSPWGFMDERALAATMLRKAAYESGGIANPVWTAYGQGTVSYRFAGVGPSPGVAGTTLCAPIASAADTSITICDAGKLDLSVLPARILIGDSYLGAQQEEIRIEATTATTGQATLTVAYDGRGQLGGSPHVVPAQAWPKDSIVGQYKVSGTNTLFLTDPVTAICPAGAPGPPGTVVYDTGRISLTPGSKVATGAGTSWSTANKVIETYFVRVSATHGGTSFVFVAPIASVADPTHLTLGRNYPSDADAGSFSYAVIAYRYLVLHYTRADGTDGSSIQWATGCESETNLYGQAAHDYPEVNATAFIGMHYGYKDSLGAQSAFGPNFYGEGLAHRAFYYRSGLQAALDTADAMDEHWVKDPEIDGGRAGGMSLLLGGGAIGAFADLILNPRTSLTWSDVRHFATIGSIGNLGCNDADARDSGYQGAWLTLAALFDPDAAQRAKWKTALRAVNARDNKCKGSDATNTIVNNSWANGFYWNPYSPNLNVTNGSAVVTAPNNDLKPDMCHGIAAVNVTVTNGSTALAGTGLVPGGKIVINGTRNSRPYTGFFQFSMASATAGTLAVLWPGDSGTYSALIEDTAPYWDWNTVIASSVNDPMLNENWACTFNSPSQITLNRPWTGPSDSTGANRMYRYVLAGWGQQPYMLGIKTQQMRWGSYIDDTEAANFGTLAAAAAQWIKEWGYDNNTQGLNYGRIFAACEPTTTATPYNASSPFTWRTPNCQYGLDPPAVRAARALNGEIGAALGVLYQANPTQENKDWGDRVYGSLWGYPPWTTENVYSDSNWVRDETSDAALAAYKWTGFFFGMGMAHQWPAARLGGTQPATPATANIPFDLRNVPGADRVAVTVTQPSGARKTYSCPTSPCAVQVDRRQGAHWFQIAYLSPAGRVLSRVQPELLDVRSTVGDAAREPQVLCSRMDLRGRDLKRSRAAK